MISSLLRHFRTRTPWFMANFDSCSALAKALGSFLNGHEFSGVGEVPNSELFARIINALPWEIQKTTYIKGSSREAVDPAKLGKVKADDFSKWATGIYPERKYPAILIGSSSGAAVHLGAAMKIPWLPQTFMVPVRTPDHLSVDEPAQRMEWARKSAHEMLVNNPDLQLHHMMDPNQDRIMLSAISYFRTKRILLGEAYKNFITQNLEKEGTILIVECQKTWPTTQVDERHFFQFGGLGGLSPEDYQNGNDQIRAFLKGKESHVKQWSPPKPDTDSPESEWGFEPTLKEDIENFAEQNGYRVQRIVYKEPEELSPFVAELYRWWYAERNIPAKTLIADMFFLVEPYWTLRTGSVPFWLAFNAKPSINHLKEYLQHTQLFDNIHMLPFSHGVKAIGLATREDMESALSFAEHNGSFIGSEPDLYPYDFGIYARYQKDLPEKITSRYGMNDALSLEQLYQFAQQTQGKFKVEIED